MLKIGDIFKTSQTSISRYRLFKVDNTTAYFRDVDDGDDGYIYDIRLGRVESTFPVVENDPNE
jgi:hypothetical protein